MSFQCEVRASKGMDLPRCMMLTEVIISGWQRVSVHRAHLHRLANSLPSQNWSFLVGGYVGGSSATRLPRYVSRRMDIRPHM